MNSISTLDCPAHFNDQAYSNLNQYISQSQPSKIIVLVDTNTRKYCLEKFLAKLIYSNKLEIIEIEAGEEYKTISTCTRVWEELSDLGADRKSLIINVGGGVITDLGGFVASTFKRGVEYINVPTSLLAMVDASVGGKTGVDLGALKNQIGVINSGKMVVIDTTYLNTLPENHLRSGLSEMLKHGLIYSETYWNDMRPINPEILASLDNLIHKSVEIKNEIVTEDPEEEGRRKSLNFGHTLGHAIESYYLDQSNEVPLLHGEAIAIGMILETFISHKILDFPSNDLENVRSTFNSLFDCRIIKNESQKEIINLLKFDKKNSHGRINFVLLQEIGKPKLDCQVENSLILEAFDYYNENL